MGIPPQMVLREIAKKPRPKSPIVRASVTILNVTVGEEKDGTSMPLLSLKNNVKSGNTA